MSGKLTSIMLLAGLLVPLMIGVVDAVPFQQDTGPNGIVSVEAENFDENTPRPPHTWELITEADCGPALPRFAPPGGFSGGAAMQSTPATPGGGATINTGYTTTSPRLDYQIEFVKTGTHYVWVLAWSLDSKGDSLHAGLNGQALASSSRISGFESLYTWTNSTLDPRRATIEVPSVGVHTLNIWLREDGSVVDKIVLTTNPNYKPTRQGPPQSPRGVPEDATTPVPADGIVDVARDTILAWQPSAQAATHDLYLGTDFDRVSSASRVNPLEVLVRQGLRGSDYAPAALEFGTTYYWRIDGVKADGTIFKGNVWSFTVEPYSYPITSLTATASSAGPNTGPEKTIDRSGLDGDRHSTELADMWLSAQDAPQPAWIQYAFDRAYTLDRMQVWNSNMLVESSVGFGARAVTVEHSMDGERWTVLGDVEFAQAPGRPDYTPGSAVDFSGVLAQYVRLTIRSNWGATTQYSLSEVRFLQVPVSARQPDPPSGGQDVDVAVILSWRPGRKAARQEVRFGTDAGDLALVATVTESRYDTAPLDLQLGTTYYWQVNEVNEAATPSVWPGDLWSFSTQSYLVVEDFESYTDEEGNRIYEAWADGWENPQNGSQVGYLEGPFTEQVHVHGGGQSMPLFYDNAGGITSAALRVFDTPQDWTVRGLKALTLWFSGEPSNTPAQVYVAVNGRRVLYDGPADSILQKTWRFWYIDLTAFAGANLSRVTELEVGVTGGAKGVVYIDDILLSPYSRHWLTPTDPGSENLVAHYAFDGDTSERTGKHPGTAVGAPQFVEGKVGQAISLGSGRSVQIAGYKGILGTSPVTVAAWINTTSDSTEIIRWGPTAASAHGQQFRLRIHWSRLRFEHTSDIHGMSGDTIINDGVWRHVAVTIQPKATLAYPDVILWLDGRDDTRRTSNPIPFNLTAHEDVVMAIGGLLDEVHLYDRVLTREEIMWLAGSKEPIEQPFVNR